MSGRCAEGHTPADDVKSVMVCNTEGGSAATQKGSQNENDTNHEVMSAMKVALPRTYQTPNQYDNQQKL